jgi:hypothetical protein
MNIDDSNIPGVQEGRQAGMHETLRQTGTRLRRIAAGCVQLRGVPTPLTRNQYFLALIDPSWPMFPQLEPAIEEEELYSIVSPVGFLVFIFHG